MYTRHECCLNGAGVEAGLLVGALRVPGILLQGTPDSLDGVRGCCRQIGGLPEKAALYFCCEGCIILFCTERAARVSIDCYDPARSWHLELEVCIVWYCVESSQCGSSKQCMIATTERDEIKD